MEFRTSDNTISHQVEIIDDGKVVIDHRGRSGS